MEFTEQEKKEIAILKEKDEQWQNVLKDPLVAEVVAGFEKCEADFMERLVCADKTEFEWAQAHVMVIRNMRKIFERPFSSRLSSYGINAVFSSIFGNRPSGEDSE